MSVAPRTASAFVDWLVARHPDLAPILDEHLKDMDDELLPHVFFGDVTRYAAELARRHDTGKLDPLLHDLNGVLDDSDDYVDNLVWVSFVENSQASPGDPEKQLRESLRGYPNLARALSHYE